MNVPGIDQLALDLMTLRVPDDSNVNALRSHFCASRSFERYKNMSHPIALLSALFLFFFFIGLAVSVSNSQQEEIDDDQQRLKDDYKVYLVSIIVIIIIQQFFFILFKHF